MRPSRKIRQRTQAGFASLWKIECLVALTLLTLGLAAFLRGFSMAYARGASSMAAIGIGALIAALVLGTLFGIIFLMTKIADRKSEEQRRSLGFIFDWDGVIIDSHAAHEESWSALFVELGKTLPEGFFKKTFGMRNQQIIPEWFDFVKPDDLAEIKRLGDRKEELYRDILRRDGISPLPGVLPLLRQLKVRNIPRAIGSSSPRENLDFVMKSAGLEGLFDAIVSAEDVKLGKPDPQVFLLAAEKIGVKPENCIVFEDAHVGIEAGKRAGMKVIAVATTHPIESLHHADAAFQNLDGMDVDRVLAVRRTGVSPVL